MTYSLIPLIPFLLIQNIAKLKILAKIPVFIGFIIQQFFSLLS